MIRKAIIVVLTLGALGSCLAWGISYVGISGGHRVYTKPDIDPIPQGSIVSHNFTLHDGIFHVERSGYPARPISSERSTKIRKQFEPGWGFGVLDENYERSTQPWWRPRIYRFGASVVDFTVPLWQTTLILGAWPAVAFWHGPLRRYRRRRKGLCLNCGYNLEGNVSGVCSECGDAVV